MMFRAYNDVYNGTKSKSARAASVVAPSSYARACRRGAGGNSGVPFIRGGAIASIILILALTLLTAPAAAQGPLTLEECIAMALENNASIRTANEKMEEMNAVVDESMTTNKPTVSASASYAIAPIPAPKVAVPSSPIPLISQPIPPGTIPPGTFPPGMVNENEMVTGFLMTNPQTYRAGMHGFSIGFTATQVLYTGGRIQTAQQISRHSRTVSEWQRKSTIREVRRDVTKAYYQALSVSKSIMALDSAIALMEITVNDMKNLVEVGMLGEHEVLLMEVEISNLRLSRQQVITGAQSAHDYLAMLIGVTISEPLTLVNDLETPQSFGIPEMATLQARAKAASTDIKALEEQLKIIDASLIITGATHIPTVVAQVGYTGGIRTNGNIPNDRGKTPFLADWTNSGSIAIAAQWDIYNGGAVDHKKRQALSQKRQLKLAMESIETGLSIGVRNSAASLQDAYDAIAVSRKSIEQAKRSYEISNDLFQEGMLASSELLRAHNSILQSEIAYYNALSTFYGRQADLDYLVNEEK